MIITFVVSNSPIIRVILLILITLLSSLTLILIKRIPLFPYLIFLIFLGGLIILFTYICRLNPNEKILIKLKESSFLIILFLIIFTIFWSGTKINKDTHVDYFFYLIKTIFFNNERIYVFIFIYLLLTLFSCVFLCKKKEGAIRLKKVYEIT